MCSDRLAARRGARPACRRVPNQAIAIQIVDKSRALEDAQAGALPAGRAVARRSRVPTTVYVTKRAVPAQPAARRLLPGARRAPAPAAGVHAGADPAVGRRVRVEFAAAPRCSGRRLGAVRALARARRAGARACWRSAASVFHLGRPQVRVPRGARAAHVVAEPRDPGVRRCSPGAAALYAAVCWPLPSALLRGRCRRWLRCVARRPTLLGAASCGAGWRGVVCSVMIYVDDRRASGGAARAPRSASSRTAAVLGLATTLVSAASPFGCGPDGRGVHAASAWRLACWRSSTGACKLLCEAAILLPPRATSSSARCKRTALLLTGDSADAARRAPGAGRRRRAAGAAGARWRTWLTAARAAAGAGRSPRWAALRWSPPSCSNARCSSARASPPRMPGSLA